MIENGGEDQQENGVDEVDSCNGDVESVGFLVHPWPENADTNKEAGFNDNQCDGLSDPTILSKSDEQRFDENVAQSRHNEVVSRRTELDI